MSLPQGWIQMIQPELHKMHPFLVLPSDASYTHSGPRGASPGLIFLGFTDAKPPQYHMLFLVFCLLFNAFEGQSILSSPLSSEMKNISVLNLLKLYSIGEGETKP